MSARWVLVGAAAVVVPWLVIHGGHLGGAAAAQPAAGVYHWPQHVVYVEDHTAGRWPVLAATRTWDAGITTDLRYGRCRGERFGCIRVYDVVSDDGTTIGTTDYNTNGAAMTQATVRMNNENRRPPYGSPHIRLAGVCHELGHALGLPHDEARDSCLNAEVGDTTSTHPGKRDLALLQAADQ